MSKTGSEITGKYCLLSVFALAKIMINGIGFVEGMLIENRQVDLDFDPLKIFDYK